VRLADLTSLLAPPLCWGCGGVARSGEALCGRCRAKLRPATTDWIDLDGILLWAATSYEGPARRLVAALKFRAAIAVADVMAARIAALVELPPDARLVPVPLHPARQRRRGYNQAQLLAAALGRRSGRGVEDCLVRDDAEDRPQVGRDRGERAVGPSGRIQVRDGWSVPEEALLVDDVATTGATLRACAGALRGAGALSVRAVAFARTPGR
jgi:ComF family protein